MANTIAMFPDRLKSIRENIGLSQEQFAQALGVVRATIGYYETGKRRPDIDILNKIVEKTGCSVEYLMGYTPAMNPAFEKEVIATGLDEQAIEAIGEYDTDTLGFMVKNKHFEKMIWLMSAISDPIIKGNMEKEELNFYYYQIAEHAKLIAIDIASDENMAALRMAQRAQDGHYWDCIKEHEASLGYVKKGRAAAHNAEKGGQNCFLPYDMDELALEVLEEVSPQKVTLNTPASDTKQDVTASKKRGRPKGTPDYEIMLRLTEFKQKMERRGGEENGMQAD